MKLTALKFLLPLSALCITACSDSGNTSNSTASNTGINNALLASNANVRLGIAYLQRDEASEAKQKLLTSINEDRKNPAAWYSLGYYYEATGNRKQAEKDYLYAIKLAPSSGIPKNNYGTFLCRQGRYKEAIKQFMAAVDSPGYFDSAHAYENAGICSMLIPNEKQAKQYFTRALFNNPKLPTSLLELAKIDYQQGQLVRAKRLYNRLLSLGGTESPEAKMFGQELMYHQHYQQFALPSPRSEMHRSLHSNS